MLDIFSSIPIHAKDANGNLVHAQIQMHGKDLFTGIIHIRGAAQLVFLFALGKLISIYRLSENHWRDLPKMEWDETIAASSGELRVASLSIENARVIRLFLESDFSAAKTIPSVPAGELTFQASRWRGEHRAAIVTVRREDAGALLLFPAGESTFTEAVLVSDIQSLAGPAVANQIRSWGDRSCQVTTCVADDRSEAWREYFLRVSSGKFIQNVLQRYGELAGQFLITDLNELVNDEAKSWGLALSLYGINLSNRQFFETLDRAGRAYVMIFNIISEHMQKVIGEKVVTDIHRDAIMQLELDDRILVQEYVISRLDQGMQEDL